MTRVEDDGSGGSTVYVVTAEDSARACPTCGVFATRLKGYRTTRPRHLPCGGRQVSIRWRKARWHCTEPACERGSFTEAIRQLPAGMRTTLALRRAAGAAVCDGGRTVVQAGRDLRLSRPVVQHCFEDHAAQVLPEVPPATPAIGIDETRRGKPVWKQNPSTGKWELVADAWHIGFVDAIGGQGLFGQVEGRNAASVADWFSAQPASWREQVRHVAIDLCSTFRAAVHRALPHAAAVVDCFHIVQLAQRHLADLRRHLTWKQRGRRARKGDGICTVRKLLRRHREDLTEGQRTLLKAELEYMGTYGRQIHAAWQAKELLRDLLHPAVSRTHVTPDRSAISAARHRFFVHIADHAHLPELVTLAETVEQWWDGIETYLTTGITNAPEEWTSATASRLNCGVYRLLVLLFLPTIWTASSGTHPSQYQPVQVTGELHPPLPPRGQPLTIRELMSSIEWLNRSRRVHIEATNAVCEGVQLAIEQVQDVRLALLEGGPEPTWEEILVDVLVGIALDPAINKLWSKLLVEQFLTPMDSLRSGLLWLQAARAEWRSQQPAKALEGVLSKIGPGRLRWHELNAAELALYRIYEAAVLKATGRMRDVDSPGNQLVVVQLMRRELREQRERLSARQTEVRARHTAFNSRVSAWWEKDPPESINVGLPKAGEVAKKVLTAPDGRSAPISPSAAALAGAYEWAARQRAILDASYDSLVTDLLEWADIDSNVACAALAAVYEKSDPDLGAIRASVWLLAEAAIWSEVLSRKLLLHGVPLPRTYRNKLESVGLGTRLSAYLVDRFDALARETLANEVAAAERRGRVRQVVPRDRLPRPDELPRFLFEHQILPLARGKDEELGQLRVHTFFLQVRTQYQAMLRRLSAI